MSQASVERVIGRLMTDEALRRRFLDDPCGTLQDLAQSGIELNPCELRALCGMDAELIGRLADAIDPRLQKIDPKCGAR